MMGWSGDLQVEGAGWMNSNMQVADVPGVAEVNGALDWACCPLRDYGVLPGKRNI